jgi:hypothetical protein
MPACHASAEITRELLEKDRTPHAITYVPEFISPQYTSQIEHWMNGVGDGDSSTQINVADGKRVDEFDFGHAATVHGCHSPVAKEARMRSLCLSVLLTLIRTLTFNSHMTRFRLLRFQLVTGRVYNFQAHIAY